MDDNGLWNRNLGVKRKRETEREKEMMEKLEKRYLRWMLGIERCLANTPSYLVREELLREGLGGRPERKAWTFEKRLEAEKS